MFAHMHGRGGRGCGPRGTGEWSRGPFAVRWDFGSGERPEHGRGGGGRRRMFDGSELRLVLLRMIADEPRHGYELIKAIEELTGGAYAPSPGMVYPALTMLAEMELVAEQASETTRKRFGVTEAGTAHLAEQAEVVAALMARLVQVGEHRARPDHVSVRRAVHNLRSVLQNRLGAGDLSEDAVHDVTAMIDDLARRIERLK
jgi:DNA-binding PadR family transcriptional regulator